MPTIKELQAFIAVVESGSFQGAARRLNATPPAISKRMSELEADLGVRLFERSTRHCHITARGRALVPHAQRVLAEVGEIRRTIGQRSALVGHILLGVVETIALTQLPAMLKKFSADLEGLTVEVEVGHTNTLVRKVHTGELDIACVVAPVLNENLASEPFWDIEMSWIGPGKAWKEKPLTIDELAERPLLLQSGSRHIPIIEGWFKRGGVRPKNIINCSSLSAAVKMTAAGLGLSLVPIECARREIDSGVVTTVPVRVDLPTNSFVVIYPRNHAMPYLDGFLDLMREFATSLNAKEKSRMKPRAKSAR